MYEIAITIGDFEMDETDLIDLFLSVFFSTPIILKSSFEGMDNFLSVCKVDNFFIRIDVPSLNGLQLTRNLRKKYPDKRLIWVAKEESYALSAFDEAVDAFLSLPVTEKKLESIQRRLTRFGRGVSDTT